WLQTICRCKSCIASPPPPYRCHDSPPVVDDTPSHSTQPPLLPVNAHAGEPGATAYSPLDPSSSKMKIFIVFHSMMSNFTEASNVMILESTPGLFFHHSLIRSTTSFISADLTYRSKPNASSR
ncbi:hypothetical protein V8G54_011731, partial [Vigna mungo]